MKYDAKQAIFLPVTDDVTDYLALEFLLMDNRPGVKPEPFVVELVKRWFATERHALRCAMGKRCAVFNGKMCSCRKGPHCERAMATRLNSQKSLATASFPMTINR